MASSSSTSAPPVAERRGIPGASFVEDVPAYLARSGLDVNSALSILQERLQQYKVVEMKLLAQQRGVQAKIPDIEKCLDLVTTLQAKEDTGEALVADFEVSEGIYSQARIEDTDSVCLWLGANVMLEYSCVEVSSDLCAYGHVSRTSIGRKQNVGQYCFMLLLFLQATVLLQKNLENARASLEVLVADLQFLRDQVTITQVTIARVYNWDVHQRRIK